MQSKAPFPGHLKGGQDNHPLNTEKLSDDHTPCKRTTMLRTAHWELPNHIRDNVSIPVIASRGAGKVEHFTEVYEKTDVETALATGIFHREEIPIEAAQKHLQEQSIGIG